MEKIKIIVTGAGGAASIGFCRSLNDSDTDYEIIGLDRDRYHLSLARANHRYLVPGIDSPDYINVLNYISNKHHADFLHCQPDLEIEFLSAHRKDINVKTNLPSQETIDICINKWKSYKKWKSADVKVPLTVLIENKENLLNAFVEEDLGPTIWLRNIKGAGGKGSLPTSDKDEACAWLDFCNGYGSFTAAKRLSDRTVTWSSIWDNGKLVIAQARERLYWEYSNNSPSKVTGLTGTGFTIDDKMVTDVALSSIWAIDSKPHGIFSVDMVYDFNGIPNPTEINIGRFFTTHYFFTCAGINFPDIFVRTSLGMPVTLPPKRINPIPKGLAWVRGMDVEPVLCSMSKFGEYENKLSDMITQIG